MTVKKGLKTLANNNPNFSNQGLENSINGFKIGWVLKSFALDTAIDDNTVLTVSQKNDLKDDINALGHINMGRVIGDLIRHTNTILDGSIVPVVGTGGDPTTFLEILQTVQTIQTNIPELYGTTPAEQSRTVDDHLGTLNNIFTEKKDSSIPVFTTLNESVAFINTAGLASDTAYQLAITNLIGFLASVVADSTDFQKTLDTFATTVGTAAATFNTALAAEPYLTHRTRLIAARENINVQISLENSNLSRIDTFVDNLTSHFQYASLAEDENLRTLMGRISQNPDWKQYFVDYEENSTNLNPIYTTNAISDKDSIIDTVLRDSGLPDVLDFVNIEAVANKAKKDSRVDTKGYDLLTVEQQIADACKQLNITTSNRSVYNQSESLLTSLNQRDRDNIAKSLELNESSDTLS